jgi:DNA topoisomerase-3
MMELEFPQAYSNWSARDPSACFSAPVVRSLTDSSGPISEQLQIEARNADAIMLWLDCDREGENICFEVIEVCKKANPALEIWRARFASIVPREIVQACNNPVRPNELEAQAVDARIELDLRTGASWTRFLTLRYKDKFDGVNETISYGPCQFPTLGFVVHRFNQIEAFVPEPFWKLVLEVDKSGKAVTFNWERVRVFDQAICSALFDQCIKGGICTVTHVGTNPKTKYRPFPMTTVKLQQLGTSKLRMSSEKLMEVAEKLYQRGLRSLF